MTTTTVHLVRRRGAQPRRILYGRLPGYQLSARGGRWRSASASTSPAPTSPSCAPRLLRAQQTAAPIAAAHDLEISTDQRLIESGNRFEGQRMGHGDAKLTDPRNWRWFRQPLPPLLGQKALPGVEVARVVSAVARGPGRGPRDARPCWSTAPAADLGHPRRSAEGKPLFHDPRQRGAASAR